ncbi:uncharacterized protein EV154DRAFT_487394 [Mucor mucedo]|uniref:uncharacterized protein n=2 Tax=Mucor mucedo TaxID=29922 RepID=UPI0022200942|nr:uncharacterized protein EV154DRAFT_487394 [Mucor mucedo]KAI7873176.1 hypothetical protein EV154DRAFT_487394 [Mucor mucedo]
MLIQTLLTSALFFSVTVTAQTDKVDFVTVETQLSNLPQLQALVGKVSPDCYDAYARYSCSLAYPKCVTGTNNTISVMPACTSSCETVHQYCSSIFAMAGQSQFLPDCSSNTITSTGDTLQPDATCNNIPTKLTPEEIDAGRLVLAGIPEGFVMQECPSPFLKDPLAKQGSNDTLDPHYCQFGCCIPCPAQNLFYKENWATRGFLATDILRFISAILSFVLVISYLILPDKRRHPSLLILNLSIAIFLFSMGVFFSVGNPKRLQCAANGISTGEMGNNTLCAAQGAILIFGSFATVLWCSALILNLHVHTVWNSNFFTNRYVLLNIICWGIPTTIMSIALGLHAIKFEFANLCLVSMKYIFPMFFYPLAAVVCPSFIIHIGTFFYIAKIAVREGLESDMTQSLSTGTITDRPPGVSRKHVIVAVKIQWRALLLAIIAIVTVLFYWLFYMTQMSRMTDLQNNPRVTLDWIQCMLTPGKTQNMCAAVISPHLPPFSLIIVAEVLVSTIGIWLFIMFGKRSLWREWNDLIYDLRIKMGGRGGAEKHGEQFFAL